MKAGLQVGGLVVGGAAGAGVYYLTDAGWKTAVVIGLITAAFYLAVTSLASDLVPTTPTV